ncbi:MAG: SMC-Scp complex subunit ScpB [Candidatus Vogelbacteria bacterium]|nr:SMC-Scp complex subunit ScpB [Candidatus Vogelbacteria bacterium]
MTLEAKIEALLFFKAEPLTISDLAKALESDEPSVGEAIEKLKIELADRGVKIIQNGDEIALGTTPEASDLIQKITKEELAKDLGKATLETLTIILYEGPISRAKIDHIRGVNSSFIVRNLLIRGLIERTVNEKDARAYLYKPTFDLLQHLGLTDIKEMPEYEIIHAKIAEFQKASTEEVPDEEGPNLEPDDHDE